MRSQPPGALAAQSQSCLAEHATSALYQFGAIQNTPTPPTETPMSNAGKPFRADHVGSLLRTPALLAAREQFANQQITREQLLRLLSGLEVAERRAI